MEEVALEIAVRQLGETWKTDHPLEWNPLRAHICRTGCPLVCVYGRVHEVPGSGLHPCLPDRCPIREGNIAMHVVKECWVCRTSGFVHLCGSFCGRWQWSADSERVCCLTGIVIGVQFQGDVSQLVWHPEVRRPWSAFRFSRWRRGRIEERDVEQLPNVWTQLVGHTANFHEHVEYLSKHGWNTAGDALPRDRIDNKDDINLLVVRCARALLYMFSRSPTCPFEQRILSARLCVANAMRFARAAPPNVALDAAWTQLRRKPPPQTWVPSPENRLNVIITLGRAVLVLWRACIMRQIVIEGAPPSLERFALAAVAVLGTEVVAERGGCAFPAFDADPRLARLPTRETATVHAAPRAHDQLVDRLARAIRLGVTADPRVLRDIYSADIVHTSGWASALRGKHGRTFAGGNN